MPGRLRLAVATTMWLASGSNHSEGIVCALVKWCMNAHRLATQDWMPHRIDVVILTNSRTTVAPLCPQPAARFVPIGADVIDAATRWAYNYTNLLAGYVPPRRWGFVRSEGHEGWRTPPEFSVANLAKFEALRMTEYDVVVLIDSDVDLFVSGVGRGRPGPGAYLHAGRAVREAFERRLRLAWTDGVSAFLRSPAQLLGSAEKKNAILNGGVLVFKPSLGAFTAAMALLSTMRWHPLLGFNASGRPLDRMTASEKEAAGHCYQAVSNSFEIACGDSDQGLWQTVFIFQLHATQWLREERAQLTAHHFWARSKPWLGPTCVDYFVDLGLVREVLPSDAGGKAPTGSNSTAASASGARPRRRRRYALQPSAWPGDEQAAPPCWAWLEGRAAALLRAGKRPGGRQALHTCAGPDQPLF